LKKREKWEVWLQSKILPYEGEEGAAVYVAFVSTAMTAALSKTTSLAIKTLCEELSLPE